MPIRGGGLVFAEGGHGFEGGGAARGNERGERSDEREKQYDASVGGEVRGLNLVEEALNEISGDGSGEKTDGQADGDEEQALAKNHRQNAGRSCAESHADAEFAASIGDELSEHAVKAGDDHKDGHTSESANEVEADA